MKLSTKSTYGLRAMLNIAMEPEGHSVSIHEIARNEGISASYLEQLLNKLRRKGLIESMRGPKGGYRLAGSGRRITVADIVSALEGGLYPVHCVGEKKGDGSTCKKSSGCVPKIVWARLAKAIEDCLGSVTLSDLCAESKKIRRG